MAQWLAVLVGLTRLAELVHSHRNARSLLAAGGIEYGRGHYPLLVGLHAAWLASLFFLVSPKTAPTILPLTLFAMAFALRLWAMASLGAYWTTRVITVPGAPVVTAGPYRYLRHPNYLAVLIELPALLSAFRAWWLAFLFGAANAALLAWRLRVEDAALAPRRNRLP